MSTVLEVRVNGVNRAHEYANAFYPRLVEVFAQYVGEKIVKVDGTLLAKIKKQVDALGLPCTPGLNVYRYSSDYSVCYMIKTCESHGGHAYYYEIGLYIGEMRDGILNKICDTPNFKTDHNADDVAAKRKAYEEAAKIASDAKSALHPFGEYDR